MHTIFVLVFPQSVSPHINLFPYRTVPLLLLPTGQACELDDDSSRLRLLMLPPSSVIASVPEPYSLVASSSSKDVPPKRLDKPNMLAAPKEADIASSRARRPQLCQKTKELQMRYKQTFFLPSLSRLLTCCVTTTLETLGHIFQGQTASPLDTIWSHMSRAHHRTAAPSQTQLSRLRLL